MYVCGVRERERGVEVRECECMDIHGLPRAKGLGERRIIKEMLGLGGGGGDGTGMRWDGGGYIYLCIIASSYGAGLDLLSIASLSGQRYVGRSGGMKRGMGNAEYESVVSSANFVEGEEEEATRTSRLQHIQTSTAALDRAGEV